MIPKLRNKQENPDELRVAKVRPVGRGMLEVRCPTTGEPLLLDADHAGRQFYNPNSMEFFWIPNVEPTETPRPSTNVPLSRKNAPPQGLGLKLDNLKSSTDDEDKSKKRRWWPFS
jgi:hypothetical protein